MLSIEMFKQEAVAITSTNAEVANGSCVRSWVVDSMDAQVEGGV